MRRLLLPAIGLLALAPGLAAQSVLEHSPNTYGVWTLDAGRSVFVFAHRFEVGEGGDQVFNIPTLSLALGLPLGLTAGLDFTSNSEVVTERGGNENELWLKRAFRPGGSTTLAALAGYNTAASSVDGALSVKQDLGILSLFGEGRAFSDMFGSGEGGFAGTVGAAVRLTPYLAITGDVGRVLSEDSFPSAWSAAAAIAIPGTPHTLSFQATNSGSITLHGASRSRQEIFSEIRYGFVFTVPLGTASQWARIFRPRAPEPAGEPALVAPTAGDGEIAARVELRDVAFAPATVRIRPGQSVEWINRDPTLHTVDADDGSWGSGPLQEGGRFVRRFDRAGRYAYHCSPHPQMTAVVIVEGS